MGIIVKEEFVGFATCRMRPWWKFWIRINLIHTIDPIKRMNKFSAYNVREVCTDCKCFCDNYKIWFDWYKLKHKVLSLLGIKHAYY